MRVLSLYDKSQATETAATSLIYHLYDSHLFAYYPTSLQKPVLLTTIFNSTNYLVACLILMCFLATTVIRPCSATKEENRLFEDILADYNKLVRPVDENNATLVVRFKLKLSQLLDVHEKQQIMTTNVWLQHIWTDSKLCWNPKDYGGVEVLYVPSELIWLPDIVLYNNADGNYQLSYNGTVEWTPPAIYKSMCQIDVEWFPFDAQTCEMKFGSWTYGGLEVDLKVWVVDDGIDLNDYYPSVEWDILRVPGKRHQKKYPCCISPFIDLTYEIHLRRKTLFYTVNLMIPCVGISFLTALVFYLPSAGGEKISLCISILISLTVFFLLLVEIIPSTSLVIPLIGKYLLFTMVLVTLSVITTCLTLNVHYRNPSTHKMSPWIRKLFIEILPYYLLMRRPIQKSKKSRKTKEDLGTSIMLHLLPNAVLRKQKEREALSQRRLTLQRQSILEQMEIHTAPSSAEAIKRIAGHGRESSGLIAHFASTSREREQDGSLYREQSPLKSAVDSVAFIAEHFQREEDDQRISNDWTFVAMVLDRIFLITFTVICFFGCVLIIFRAPTIWSAEPALGNA
ncbi:unnamed protein product [Meloidogyne enterolobii]|uniref:Uncharacterized protein n=1 Tax=Meloidogyne enterolobii TaxID=390850 RepID=A0ACB1AIH4_MELEN